MTNPATGGGALNCRSGRFDTSEYTAPITNTQHDSAAITAALSGPRQERQITLIHALGPRVFAELLGDIARRTGQSSFIAHRLEEYARLDRDILRAVGGDRFPPMPLEVVR